MPTEQPCALFLFAHQDDEFGVFGAIEDSLRAGLRVRCAYLTHGAPGLEQRRDAESLQVLARLGVRDVRFAGNELDIADASLPRHLAAAARWLEQWLEQSGPIASLHVTAWEGGHHDHDALHAIACTLAAERGLLPRLRQYSLYHGNRCPGPFYRVLAPLPHNGPVQRTPIAWRARWRHLRLCLSYPSQRVTWIGLFPFVLLHYLLSGKQSLQGVSPDRLEQRPHDGPLYYEKRRFYTWPQLQHDIHQWRSSRHS